MPAVDLEYARCDPERLRSMICVHTKYLAAGLELVDGIDIRARRAMLREWLAEQEAK